MTILSPLLASAGVMIIGYALRALFVLVDSKTGLTDRLTPEEVVQVERKRVIVYIFLCWWVLLVSSGSQTMCILRTFLVLSWLA